MKRGVVKVTACCLAGSVIFASTGLTAFAAGEMPLAGIGAEIIASQEKKENSETKKVIATGYDSLVIAQVDEYVNIRDEASTETGQIVGKLYNNSAAEIIGQTGDWYLIKSGDVTGYVSKDYFVTGAQAEELAAEVSEQLLTQSETSYRNRMTRKLASLQELEQEQQENRSRARMDFNRIYASYGLSGMEKENDAYDRILEQCKRDYEPQYKEEFRMQCDQVYTSLRDNVIAAIHGEIKAAYRHAREINRLLSRIRFSDSTYQIEIRPADNENGQFYEMLMASELDSKVLDNNGFDGQMSLLEDEFYMKYKDKIDLLTEKFMPPQEGDAQNLNAKRQEMEQYADYRNYLTFSMYERVEDEDGSVRKNHVDEMAGRDSGGEGQNPKYVALLAGFAMLYMQQSSRESKVRLVLLDEAFSKMDKERSEVCLRYARELDLQLIVCVPDERLQSLIQNVDCVYGFRRFQNQISMMHIDKGDYLNLLEG
mgnify:CR=1 FL=1